MYDETPYNLFIECRSCGIENSIVDYVPSMHIFCSQCREQLIDHDIAGTHCEYVCQECETRLILLKATEIKLGESACSCGSTDLMNIGETNLPIKADKSGGLIDPGKDDNEVLEDTDWLRPGSSGDVDDDSYEDMFNQDPSQN